MLPCCLLAPQRSVLSRHTAAAPRVTACSLKLGWLPGQLKRLPKLHTLKIEARKLDAAALFKGMGAMKGLRSALLEGVQRNKKSKEQELPDDLMAPPAGHTGETQLVQGGPSNVLLHIA